MKEKVKIELPSKYVIGIKVLVPIKDNETLELCKQFIGAVSGILRREDEIDLNEISNSGSQRISVPLLRSIAETKMEGLNDAFRQYRIPFEAFLEKEEEK